MVAQAAFVNGAQFFNGFARGEVALVGFKFNPFKLQGVKGIA